MFKAEIHIEHPGCWGSEVNLRFPSLSFSSVDCRWVRHQVAHLVKAQGDCRFFKDVILYFKKRNDVARVEVLSHNRDGLYLRVLTRRIPRIGQFSDEFFSGGCIPVAPTRFVGREEIWTLGSAEKKNLADVIRHLQKKYKTAVRYLKQESFQQALTPRQRQALTLAAHMGYYDWPRKVSATALARISGLSKTAFLSSLRHAERKILHPSIQGL